MEAERNEAQADLRGCVALDVEARGRCGRQNVELCNTRGGWACSEDSLLDPAEQAAKKVVDFSD